VTSELVKPGDHAPAEQQNRSKTDVRIGQMHRLLDKDKKFPFYNFVVDPDSFGQTIENLFAFSFLVHLGKASLDMREGVPWVECREAQSHAGQNYEEEEQSKEMKGRLQQHVMTFDIETFQVGRLSHPLFTPNRK